MGDTSAIRDEKAKGIVDKRFHDGYFAMDLLKTLYEDTVDQSVKIELLIVLEEYGSHGIEAESVDQIVASLQDIFHQSMDKEEKSPYCCQLITTATSLLIQLDQLKSDVCSSLIKDLVSVVQSRVNQPDSRRLRACACQCLIQIEDFSKGLLEQYRDDFGRLARQERTDVGQDYMMLFAKVLESVSSLMEDTETKRLGERPTLQHQFSMDIIDFRQTVSLMMESTSLYTSSATWSIIKALTKLVKTFPDISPMIFRPLLLHHMPSMSSALFHLILYVQHEFEGEILNQQEEVELIERQAILLDHPSLTPAHRLLTTQWTQYYKQGENGEPQPPEAFCTRHRLKFYPRVFDPVDCQLRKLYMTALTSRTDAGMDTDGMESGMETSVLLGSLGYLHKLVWHTGKGRAAIALFRALFFIYKYHHSPSFSQDIQKIVQGLISEFPHFIPHAVDFIESIRANTPDSPVYLQTLSLLHQQVVMATEEQIVYYYDLYLTVLKKAALEKPLSPAPTLKFLHYLVENAAEIDDSSWRLGHGVLSVCRNLLICHGTDFLYTGIGDLLFFIMTQFRDVDVRDQAKFYYALLTGASDSKMRSVLQETLYGASTMTQAISTLIEDKSEKRDLSQIIYLESPVFSCERISVSATTQMDQLTANTVRGPEDTGSVENYLESLKTKQISIDLKLRLGLMTDCQFDTAHAVSVQAHTTDHQATVKGMHVACVTKQSPQDAVIRMFPVKPVPHTLGATVTFASDEKRTYSCELPQQIISFEDLLLPLFWQPTEANEENFARLWASILAEDNCDRKGMESVIVLQTDTEKFKSISRTKLGKFLLKEIDTEGEQRTLIGMFLSPFFHILLNCKLKAYQPTVVSIATDSGSILPHLQKYIYELLTE